MEISGKIIVGFFAHPDDETFGPGGTIALLAQKNDVYVICTTSGQQGENNLSTHSEKSISEIRQEELKRASSIIGVKEVFFLGFEDGRLCNKDYHEIASQVTEILNTLEPEILITFENRGVSGHIDHITISMIASYVFHRLTYIKELWYYCLNQKYANRERQDGYFVYFPPGYAESEIDKIVDTSSVWETKVKAMHEHKSQIKDVESILIHQKDLPKREHFIVVTK